MYIVGSYAYPGIPLLEGCVGSSKCVMDVLVDDLNLDVDAGVDWSRGRGGVIGRVWRWRSSEGV